MCVRNTNFEQPEETPALDMSNPRLWPFQYLNDRDAHLFVRCVPSPYASPAKVEKRKILTVRVSSSFLRTWPYMQDVSIWSQTGGWSVREEPWSPWALSGSRAGDWVMGCGSPA